MSRAKERASKEVREARASGQFVAFPTAVLRSQALANLSPHASKLLLDIACQCPYKRNGDASVAFEKVLRPRGWRSKATLYKAIKELLKSGLIVQTRQGSLHKCSLYGLGWLAIDDCGGKLDIQATMRPLGHWQDPIKLVENKAPSTPRVPTPVKTADLGTPRVPGG